MVDPRLATPFLLFGSVAGGRHPACARQRGARRTSAGPVVVSESITNEEGQDRGCSRGPACVCAWPEKKGGRGERKVLVLGSGSPGWPPPRCSSQRGLPPTLTLVLARSLHGRSRGGAQISQAKPGDRSSAQRGRRRRPAARRCYCSVQHRVAHCCCFWASCWCFMLVLVPYSNATAPAVADAASIRRVSRPRSLMVGALALLPSAVADGGVCPPLASDLGLPSPLLAGWLFFLFA